MLIAECRLRLSRKIRPHETPQLRGFFGRKFEDEVLMHNHGPDGELIYQYPRIQFKVIDSTAVLLGIGEGAGVLERLWLQFDHATVGTDDLDVLESQFEVREEALEVVPEPISYRFMTPWLGLNQKNFRSYLETRNPNERNATLARILVGNCLSVGKSLGIRFQDQIRADGGGLTTLKATLKGNSMMGFEGRFRVNVRLPNLIGLGKSVSRGFGTVTAETS